MLDKRLWTKNFIMFRKHVYQLYTANSTSCTKLNVSAILYTCAGLFD